MTSDLGQPWPGAGKRHSEGFILILHPILDFILGAAWLWEAENGKGLSHVRGEDWRLVYAGIIWLQQPELRQTEHPCLLGI